MTARRAERTRTLTRLGEGDRYEVVREGEGERWRGTATARRVGFGSRKLRLDVTFDRGITGAPSEQTTLYP